MIYKKGINRFWLCLFAINGMLEAQVPAIGTDTTLDLVQWNVQWFGDTANGPKDETTQLKNVTSILSDLQGDLVSLCEISDLAQWNKLLTNLGNIYNGVLSSAMGTQKTALLFRKSLFRLLESKSILAGNEFNFASGRLPLEVKLETLWGSKRDTIVVWVIHMKSNIGTAAEKLSSWNRREAAGKLLKGYVDSHTNWKGIVMGDWNDDLDTSILAGNPSPYFTWRKDTSHVFPTWRLSLANQRSMVFFSDVIDHICLNSQLKSSWLLNRSGITMADKFVANYANTTSDHYPVWANMSMDLGRRASVFDLVKNGDPIVYYWDGRNWCCKKENFLMNTNGKDWIEAFNLSGQRIFIGSLAELRLKTGQIVVIFDSISNNRQLVVQPE